MAGKVQYDPTKHNELKTSMEKIKEAFSEVTKEFGIVKNIVNSDFEGEASEALQTALTSLVEKMKREKEAWDAIIRQSEEIERAYIDTDASLKDGMDVVSVSGGPKPIR